MEISVLVGLGVYFLAMIAVGLHASRNQTHEGFVIGSRNVGYLPIIGSLAASFRDGAGIVVWVGFGLTIGYGGIWLMFGVLAALCIYTFFGPQVRRLALQHGYITVGELIRSSVGNSTLPTIINVPISRFSIMVFRVENDHSQDIVR